MYANSILCSTLADKACHLKKIIIKKEKKPAILKSKLYLGFVLDKF